MTDENTKTKAGRAYDRAVRRLSHRRWFAVLGRRVGARIDPVLYRLSAGRLTALGKDVLPVLLLTTTGRRSGRPRTTPLMYVRDGSTLIVTSESFGQTRPAAWPLNLEADPCATVRIGRETLTCRARRLSEHEANVYWPRLVAEWPAHATYWRRSGVRRMFRLDPVPEARCTAD